MKRFGFVALAGRPNAGKSTFLNQLLGEKVSIVSDKPQTTRNRILGVYHDRDLQIGFLDLPGIHKPRSKMNRMMARATNLGLEDSDLVYHFIDATEPLGSGDRFVHQYLANKQKPVLIVLNKIDLVNKSKMIPLVERLYQDFSPRELVPVSALSGENLARLITVTGKYLPENETRFEEDMLTDQPLRFMVQEFIREKILHVTREEIPHAVAVVLERWVETEDGYELGALIHVEKQTQRQIIIGSGGQMIRKIRHSSQRALKQLLDRPVKLELFVKVQEKWRDRDALFKPLRLDS